VAVLPKSVRVEASKAFRLERGMLRIAAGEGPRGRGAPRLDIHDLGGRLLFSIPLDRFREGGGFAIPIDWFRRFARHRLVLVLRAAGRMQSFNLNVGDRT
jgi:hypothetical protein